MTDLETKAAAEPPLDCRVMPDPRDYREGVNIERLERAMRALGLATDDSQEAFAAVMAENINRLTTAVIRSVLTRHNALAQADAACGVSPGAMGSAAS